MDWTATMLAFGFSLATALVAGWRARRPYDFTSPPLLPWNGVLFVAVLAMLVLLGHVVSLATGQPLLPRGSSY